MTSQRNNHNHHLIVVIGATGVGKSAYALSLAHRYGTEIISADSRQIYKGMVIGTDAVLPQHQASIPHHFVQYREVWEPYSADQFAKEADELLQELFKRHSTIIMVGGSMMYLQAFLEGLVPIPEPDPQVRAALWKRYEAEGVESLRAELAATDPQYLERIDPNNHKRIIRALEVYKTTGKRFTEFHSQTPKKEHPYSITIHNVTRPREELYQRINHRVRQMIERGLVQEVLALEPYRYENALNTIGYKEIFDYLDGSISLEEAECQIAKNSRVYAKQQIAYFNRWANPDSPFPYTTIEL